MTYEKHCEAWAREQMGKVVEHIEKAIDEIDACAREVRGRELIRALEHLERAKAECEVPS